MWQRLKQQLDKLIKLYRYEHTKALAEELVRYAEKHDLIVTIERKQIEPLAMRHHIPVIEVRGRMIRPDDADIVQWEGNIRRVKRRQ